MSKKNLHIKKYLNGKLPEPEVQADDAWAQMNDMLGDDSHTPDTPVPGTDQFNSLLKSALGVIVTLGIVGLIWFFLPRNSQKNKADVNSEKLSQDKNTSQYPTVNRHKESNKNTLTDQGANQDSVNSSFSPTENKIGENPTVSTDKLPDKLPSDKNSAVVTLPSTHTKTEHYISKTGKKETNNRTDQSSHPEPETIKPSSVKFKTRLKKEDNTTANDTEKKTGSQDVYSESSNRTDKNDKAQNGTQRGKPTGNDSGYTVTEIPQTYNTGKQPISGINENQDLSIKKIAFSVQNLTPKFIHFNNLSKNLAKTVKYNPSIAQQKTGSSKEKKPLFETLHVGFEWNVSSALNNSKYIFTATDSTKKPYMLLIPGIWLSKDLTENQSLTLSFYANQAYFGGLKRIQRTGADSAIFHNNINLIKATGINLSLQYNYQVVSKQAVSAGVSYSPLRSALAQNDVENFQGKVIPGPKLLLKKDNMDQYMKTNLFMIKTGLTFTPGRYQFGINLLIPLSNLSITPTSSLKTMNGQLFFRFRIK